MKHRFLIECVLIALLLPPLMVWLGQQPGLAQANLAIYDNLISLDAHEPSPDILLIGIDERSLSELGPWPWPRNLHAQLLQRLAAHPPRAILLDLFLDKPGATPEADQELAAAMLKLPVFLPLRYVEPADNASNTASFSPPLPQFARNAKGIGHAKLTPDADGIARRLFRQEGTAGNLQPYVGQLMASAHPLPPGQLEAVGADGWQRPESFGFTLAGAPRTYPSVPYVSVLRGEVPPEFLQGKILLIGAVSDSGLGDEVPVAGAGPQVHMSGLELHANAIDVLQQGRAITFAQGWLLFAWTAFPIWLVLLLFLHTARNALSFACGTALGWLLLCVLSLFLEHCWLPPTAPILGVALAYILWSWRQLNSLLLFFGDRVSALNAIPAGAFEPAPENMPLAPHLVENQTQALDRAIDRLSQMQALLSEGLWQMPVAVLICQDDGDISQSNAAAQQLLQAPAQIPSDMEQDPLHGHNLPSLLHRIAGSNPQQAVHWSQAFTEEYTTSQGKVFRLRTARLEGSSRTRSSTWLAVLQDFTIERLTQRKREQWLSFVSHDLRSPQVSILSLLNLYEQPGSGIDVSRLVHDIRREAQRTLGLAESFMDLTEAESGDYHFTETNAGAIMLDAIDQAWPYAKVRNISLVPTLGDDDCPIRVDPAMLTRALLNLLNNAIRHSPPGSTVSLCVNIVAEASEVVLTVRDEGEGISASKLAQLMSSSYSGLEAVRGDVQQPARNRGLGLSVVQAVVNRHRGWFDAYSTPGVGATFLIGLPLLDSNSPE
ncbi:CHASE2 domain-containing sensor protein [Collimonas sp. PA-H2]|uniref:CHASE2 domain-containing protein n=1 Tax=Collimonas sp. PA-H2 TaxID=1881062 RepID=UPI000BF8B6DE|nr:CHASE2 domain-containing protein [Collimonas sp. PA-H2]PFH08058.1 CHASE2 domain-containing sensor protein [Collimonas sp. PA-H2]